MQVHSWQSYVIQSLATLLLQRFFTDLYSRTLYLAVLAMTNNFNMYMWFSKFTYRINVG